MNSARDVLDEFWNEFGLRDRQNVSSGRDDKRESTYVMAKVCIHDDDECSGAKFQTMNICRSEFTTSQSSFDY